MSGTPPAINPAIKRTLVEADTYSLKRLAWAYGCARKGSQEEAFLERVLIKRAAADVTSEIEERALSWASVAVEALDRVDQLESMVRELVAGRDAQPDADAGEVA